MVAFTLGVEMLPRMPAAHIRVPGSESELCSRFPFPVNAHPGRQQGMAQEWVPATHVVDLD